MKLNGDFFDILRHTNTGSGFRASVRFNQQHIIYTGHFPGYPVTPGVIQIQIVRELLENHLGRKLRLVTMPQCKFLRIINPLETPTLEFEIEYKLDTEHVSVIARGENNSYSFLNLKAVFLFIV